MNYKRLCNDLADNGKLIPENSDIRSLLKNPLKDYYLSPYNYSEEQYQEFLKSQSVAGMTEVTAKSLWWDFDNLEDPSKAQEDAKVLINRLAAWDIPEESISVSFSGLKGFSVEVPINNTLTILQVRNIVFELAQDLETFDTTVYNANRVLRIINTRHQKSGLYKIPLTLESLYEENLTKIKESAKEPQIGNIYPKSYPLPDKLLHIASKMPQERKQVPVQAQELGSLSFATKPKFLSNCRWGLQNGFFKEGERSTALLCLASTYKNLGFDLEHVYRLLKGVAELQSQRSDCERFPDEEIYKNICMQVFASSWNNGQYTCREPNTWLSSYCHSLGDKHCNHKLEEDLKPKKFKDLSDDFKEYVKHIDENTILTGLPSIDNAVFLSTGANVGIIGAAGSGKTSVGLEILNHTSKAGVVSVCASLDMAKNRMFEKVLYRVTGLSRDDLYHKFQVDEEKPILDELEKEFGNVYFFKKSSPNVQDIKEYVINVQEQTGKRVKLVVVDYFERVNSDMGDDTAASKDIAGQLQDLVDDLDICLITLVQPNKAALSGGADKPIYDYTKIKGSSFVYQAFRIILSCWRPFYHPKDFTNDRYMQMAVLKNDLGELAEFAFQWNGKQGLVKEMEQHQLEEFEGLLRDKQAREGHGDNI